MTRLILSPQFAWSYPIVNDNLRFIHFRKNAIHPISLKDGDEKILLKDNKVYLFARKINSQQEKGLIAWMDAFRSLKDSEMEMDS